MGELGANGRVEAAEIVVATRIRLARNVEQAVFPGRASESDLSEVAALVRRSMRQAGTRVWTAHRVNQLSESDRIRLAVERWLPLTRRDCGEHAWVLLEEGTGASVLVNEEDHLRIQAVVAGWNWAAPWESVWETESVLARNVRFAKSETRWGYLTASPGNLGTGLRVSAMLHLPALAVLGERSEVLRAARSLDTAVRGNQGEGSGADGDLFQVSNAVSFGRSSALLRDRVVSLVEHLVAAEHNARLRLTGSPGAVVDLLRSVESLLVQDALPARECWRAVSVARLACVVGVARGMASSRFAEVVRMLDPAVLDDDRRRASRLRSVFAEISLCH